MAVPAVEDTAEYRRIMRTAGACRSKASLRRLKRRARRAATWDWLGLLHAELQAQGRSVTGRRVTQIQDEVCVEVPAEVFHIDFEAIEKAVLNTYTPHVP